MARLFGKEYHEHSSTWYFRSSAQTLDRDDLCYNKYRDEKDFFVLTFKASPGKEKKFAARVKIVFDSTEKKVVRHDCSICSEDTCPHFLTVIQYGYKHLDTGILTRDSIQTYQTNLVRFNEYWQRILINSYISISGMYDTTDKIRFHFNRYEPINIRLCSLLAAEKPVPEVDQTRVPEVSRQLRAFSSEEITLLHMLQQYKCSFSRKGVFFTLYKTDFHHFFPLLRNLKQKVFIHETGDPLEFSDSEFQLNFQIRPDETETKYLLKIAPTEPISALFVHITTYILRKNKVYSLLLPFQDEVVENIFREGHPLQKEDLPFFASVVARQLSLVRCFLDLDESIELPAIFDNTPVICFNLAKQGKRIVMEGFLRYAPDAVIPMAVIRFPAELVRYDHFEQPAWFYIPPQTRYEIFDFLKLLPKYHAALLETDSHFIFESEEEIDLLKKVIFEKTDPSWEITLSPELKKEFVYKVPLQPVISAQSEDGSDWFEYEVNYSFKDISFTHDELKRFFRTKEKFLKLEDGRLLFFTNRDAFQNVEQLLKKSEDGVDQSYRLSIYNIPYMYQLSSINEGFRIHGDTFLQQMYRDILNRKQAEPAQPPTFLQGIMRSYQKTGFLWLKMLQRYNLGGILADDMGLGKTLQAISILSELAPEKKVMVVCPKTLLYNWAAEIDKFNPSLTYLIYEGNREERQELLRKSASSIIIASYSIILNDLDMLRNISFEYIILDEAQHIKNAGTQRAKAIKKLRARNRLALSGTPMENNPTELWSIFDFLLPGYLPPLRRFKSEYVNPIVEQKSRQRHLAAMISPFILRRRKKEVLIELPDKQEQISYCKLSPIQEKFYLQIVQKVKQSLWNRFDHLEPGHFIHVLAALTRLRQVCNHPSLVFKEVRKMIETSGKLEMLLEILDDALESGRKLLIFSQFVEMLKLVRGILGQRHIPYEYMDGETKNRQKHVENFNQNKNIRVFLISLKTGGFGINLTAADTVILVDPWWNPMGETQAIDRTHRIGQTRKVMVYKLITKGTVEEKILNLQRNKIELFENIIEGGQHILKNLDEEELRDLFELGT